MLGNNWHKKEMPLVSLAGMGGGLSSPAFLASLILNITKPTVFSPVDDTGVPDFTYNALSSAITNIGQVVNDVPTVGPDENYSGGTSYAWGLHSVYDPSTERIVIAYTDWTNNEYGTAVVGQVDGDTLTFGTPVVFRNNKCINIKTGYDPVHEKVYIAFVNGGNGSGLAVVAGDVDPTTNSIDFGSGASFLNGKGGGILGMAYDTTNQNMVVAYHDDTVHRGKIECVTMRDAASNLLGSGPQTEFGFGIYDNISNNGGISSNIIYDPNTNRIVIAYSGMDDYDGKVIVGEGTGGSWYEATVNFGSPVRFDNLGIYSGVTHGGSNRIRMVYNPDAQKIIIGYRFQHSFDNQASYTSNAQVIAGTVDPNTNTVNFGNSTVFGDFDPRELEIGYDSNSQKMMLAYHPYTHIGGETNRLDFVTATIDGTTISVEDPVNIGTYSAVPYYTSIAYDSSNQKFVVSHTTSATGGIANVVSPVTIDPQLILADTTVSKASDGSLVDGTSIDQVLTVGERIQADTPVVNTVTAPVFSATLYQSGSGNEKTITTGIDNTDKSLVWIKSRFPLGYHHKLMDSERGSSYPALSSDNSNPQTGDAGIKELTGDGFVLHGNGYDKTNDNKNTSYVAWNFRAAPGFFDVVTYTGNGAGNIGREISHNLGSAPGMIMIKNLDNTDSWFVFHKDARGDGGIRSPEQSFLMLQGSNRASHTTEYWGNELPGSDSFKVGGATNHTGNNYVAYLFADTSGLIKCGKYTAAGSDTFINLGHRPDWVMIKRVDQSQGWLVADDKRPATDGWNAFLSPDSPAEEDATNKWILFTPNGFNVSQSADIAGSDYIYVAIAENATGDIPFTITPEATVSASSGNIISLSDVSGPWSTGMRVRGIDLDLKDNPDAILAQDISLTSSSPTAENTVNRWGDAVWEAATDAAFTQNVQTTSTALSASGTQSGPTFSYNSNTGYYVRTKYTALGQESEWSDANYFVTKLALDIEKPIILTPGDDAGIPDFDYTAKSSAITSVGQVAIAASTPTKGGQATFSSASIDYTDSTYDSNAERVIVAFRNGNLGYVSVGEVSGDSINYGTKVNFSNGQNCENITCTYDSNSQKIVVTYRTRDFSTYDNLMAVVGTTNPDNNSITFGTPVIIKSGGTEGGYHASCSIYDPNAQRVVHIYSDLTNSKKGTAQVLQVDGNSVIFGPRVIFSESQTFYPAVAYDTDTNQVILHYFGHPSSTSSSSRRSYVTLGTVSGNNISFGSSSIISPGHHSSYYALDLGLGYDPISQKAVAAWRYTDSSNNNYGTVAVGTVNGTDISFESGSGNEFFSNQARENMWVYDSASQKMVLVTHEDASPQSVKARIATISGNTITLSNPVEIEDRATSWHGITYDESNQRVVFSYRMSSNDEGRSTVISTTTSATQLTLTDTTVSKVSDGSLVGGVSIDQALTVGEAVQSSGGTESYWITTLGGAANDFGKDIAVDSSGNVYATGETDNGGQYDLVIAKYNPSGNIEWQRTLANESGPGIAVDSSDNAYVIGRTTSAGAGNNDFSIAKYNPSGGIEWQRTLGHTNSDQGYDITTDSSGGVYVVGHGRDAAAGGGSVLFDGSDDYLTLADHTDFELGSGDFTLEAYVYQRNAAGSGQSSHVIINKWNNGGGPTKSYVLRITDSGGQKLQFLWTNDGTSNNIITSTDSISTNQWHHVAAVNYGGTITLYIDGNPQSSTGNAGTLYNSSVGLKIGRTDADGGTQHFDGFISNVRIVKGTAVYTSNFTPGGPLTDISNTKLLCCQLSSSTSNYAVSPTSIYAYGNPTASSSAPLFGGGLGGDDILIAKYNSLGTIQWQVSLGDSAGNYVEAITVDSSGNVYVTGSTSYGAYQMYVSKLNSSGSVQWTRVLGDGNGTSGNAIAVDSSGNVYVTGRCRRSGATDDELWLVKYDSSGNLQSQVTLGATNTDSGNGITIDSSDNVYVIGTSNGAGTGTYDYIIAKYNPSGDIEWKNVLSASGSDQGQNIATDNSGNIYVTGYSDSAGAGNNDWLIAKLPADGSLHGIYGSFTYAAAVALTPGTTSYSGNSHNFTSSESNLSDSESFLNEEESFLNSFITHIALASGTVSASSGNVISLSDVSGTWSTGMKVQGVTIDTKDNPSAVNSKTASFTSSEPSAPQTLPSGYSWDTATWQVATDENFTQNVQTATSALSATGTQTGPSFSLEADTGYYTRTKYTALGQESEWSDVTYFVTKANVYVDDVFSTTLWSGTGLAHEIETGIDNTANTLIWTKSRNYTNSHRWYTPAVDSIIGGPSILYSNIANNPGSPGVGDMTGFTENGFTVAADSNANTGPMNSSNLDYVAWNFKAAPGFFDVVTWTGTNDGTRIPHNLGSLPGMIMVKNLDSYTENWRVYAKKEMWIDGETYAYHRLELNTTSSNIQDTAGVANTDTFNPQAMGSEASGKRYVAYLFADGDARFGVNGDESIIKCGSVTTSSGVIPDVNLGFEPQWLLIKNIDTTANWYLYDSMRGMPVGTYKETIYPNLLNSSLTGANTVELTSTGFTGGPDYLASGAQTLIYMAIRRPHKPATVVTDLFDIVTAGGAGTPPPQFRTNFPVDLVLRKGMNNAGSPAFASRLQGETTMSTSSRTNVEGSAAALKWDYSNGWSSVNETDSNLYAYMFKRSPGFMDVVTYKGTGSPQTINHNLGVSPEMMIVKSRNGASGWAVYHSSLQDSATSLLFLHSENNAYSGVTQHWDSSDPTSTSFRVANDHDVNRNTYNYVAYLFATQSGISKVGSYIGNGPNGAQQVDCGFTNGAAFILVKNASSDGDWYLLDSERGINAYNQTEPYITLNNAATQQTANILGYHNVGFMVSGQYGSASLNNANEKYIFFAIANP